MKKQTAELLKTLLRLSRTILLAVFQQSMKSEHKIFLFVGNCCNICFFGDFQEERGRFLKEIGKYAILN